MLSWKSKVKMVLTKEGSVVTVLNTALNEMHYFDNKSNQCLKASTIAS